MARNSVVRWVLASTLILTAPLAWSLGFEGKDLNGLPCQGSAQGYGPFDYTDPQQVRKHLGVVEHYHFTAEVERLMRGKSGSVLGDLGYTLMAFPNHHRALYAVIRFVLEPEHKRRTGMGTLTTPPECYLQRALRFKPNDGKVHMLLGLYLHKLGKLADAEVAYRAAVKYMPENAEANYNLGLALFDQNKFAEALPVAKKAYQLGYPLAGLRKRLAAAGHPLTP